MDGRLLKRSILQPSTDGDKLEKRWAAVDELMTNGQLLSTISDGMLTETLSWIADWPKSELKSCVDTDKALANVC